MLLCVSNRNDVDDVVRSDYKLDSLEEGLCIALAKFGDLIRVVVPCAGITAGNKPLLSHIDDIRMIECILIFGVAHDAVEQDSVAAAICIQLDVIMLNSSIFKKDGGSEYGLIVAGVGNTDEAVFGQFSVAGFNSIGYASIEALQRFTSCAGQRVFCAPVLFLGGAGSAAPCHEKQSETRENDESHKYKDAAARIVNVFHNFPFFSDIL